MKQRLFVDTNIFLFLLTKQEKVWERVASILDDDTYDFFTSILVLNELKYKLLQISATEKLSTTKKYDIVAEIKKNPTLRNEVYSKYMEFYLSLGHQFTVLENSVHHELLSCSLSTKYGLLPMDAGIVATMLKHNIPTLFTDDKDFDKITEIKVIFP